VGFLPPIEENRIWMTEDFVANIVCIITMASNIKVTAMLNVDCFRVPMSMESGCTSFHDSGKPYNTISMLDSGTKFVYRSEWRKCWE
jgi:hypothetical protein